MPTLENDFPVRVFSFFRGGAIFGMKKFRRKFFCNPYFPGVIYMWGNPVFIGPLFKTKKIGEKFFYDAYFFKDTFWDENFWGKNL